MGLLSSIAKVALPAVGGMIPGIGGTIAGMVGQGIAGHISEKSNAKAAANEFRQQKQLQDEFNLFSAKQAEKSMQFSHDEAQGQMDFQKQMSDTAHQREMADLEKAGLNPILSAKYGGSSTPGGASGTGAQPSNLQSPAQTKASATAVRHARLAEQSIQAEIALKRAQATATLSQAEASKAEVGYKTAQTTELTYQQKERIDTAITKALSETRHLNADSIKKNFEADIMRDITYPGGQIDIEKAKLTLRELQIKLEILNGPDGKDYVRRELGAKGGALSATYNTTLSILGDAYSGIKNMLDGILEHGKKRHNEMNPNHKH